MRAPTSLAVVVRRRDGSLHVRERAMPSGKTGAAKLPFARGIASLVESLRLGMEALTFAQDLFLRDREDDEPAPKKGSGIGTALLSVVRAVGYALFLLLTTDAEDVNADAPKAEKESKGSRAMMAFMVVAMLGLMIALPQAAATGANRLFKLGLDLQSPGFQVLTGLFKLTIVVGYMLSIRRIPDIRRTFQYHGAEHKTISTYEANESLTVENARAKTTLHPRCGTTFLVMVALVSILVFTGVGGFLPKIQTGNAALDNVVFFFEKLPFIPFIVGITFEIQRLFARYCTTGPLRMLLWPGFLCQKITTIEPDDDQLEVALASLRVTLFREKGEDTKAGGDVRYRDFGQLMQAPMLRRSA